MSRSIRPLAIAALLAAPLPAAAQSITGQAAVRPQAPLGVKLTPGGAVKPGATGLSLAGTKVFNPVTEDYEISDKFLAARTPGPPGGTANELTQMQSVIPLVQALVPLAAPPATAAQKAVAEAAFAGGAKEAFKPVAPKPPATVGDFTRITKGVLDTGTVRSANNAADGGLESATARAKQDAVKTPGSLITTGTSATALISASKMLMSPQPPPMPSTSTPLRFNGAARHPVLFSSTLTDCNCRPPPADPVLRRPLPTRLAEHSAMGPMISPSPRMARRACSASLSACSTSRVRQPLHLRD
jgi:hypothetical protein